MFGGFFVLHNLTTQGKCFGKGRSFKIQLRTVPGIRDVDIDMDIRGFFLSLTASLPKSVKILMEAISIQ